MFHDIVSRLNMIFRVWDIFPNIGHFDVVCAELFISLKVSCVVSRWYYWTLAAHQGKNYIDCQVCLFRFHPKRTIAHFKVTAWNEAEVDLVLIQPFLLYYVNPVVLMQSSILSKIYIRKGRRIVSKQGQP